MLNIEKAIKFQFDDPEWKRKIIPMAVVYGVVFFIYFFGIFSIYLLPIFATDSDSSVVMPFLIGYTCIFLLSLLIFIVYMFYMSGHMLLTIKAIQKDENSKLIEPAPVMERFVLGFKFALANLIPYSVVIILTLLVTFVCILIIVLIGAAFGEQASPVIAILSMLFYFLWLGFFTIIAFVYSYLYMPVLMYLYLKHGFKSVWMVSEAMALIKSNWKDFGLVGLLLYAASMMIAIVIYIPCIGLLALPFLTIIIINAMSHLYGQTFAKIDKAEIDRVRN